MSVNSRHKYGAKRSEYRGVSFPSMAERDRAEYLDSLIVAGEIDWYITQPRVFLGDSIELYRPDFMVHATETYGAASIREESYCWFEDVKGMETPAFKKIRKRWEKFGPAPLVVVKRSGKKWKEETIYGASTKQSGCGGAL